MHFNPPIVFFVPTSSCSLRGLLLYHSPVVVCFDHGYPFFRNFHHSIPVDVIRVRSYENSILDPMCVPVRILINKRDLVLDRIAAALVGVFRNSRGLGMCEWYIPVEFFHPLLHGSPSCFLDLDFAALAGNPVDNAILFNWIDSVLWL